MLTFIAVRSIYSTRFKLILNAIRDNEDKAEAMGIETMKYKIIGWMISAFFCGLAGGIMGGLVGYIDSTDVAFDGREMGVFMVLMAILGGKGTLWGPIIGATIFHIFKEGFLDILFGLAVCCSRSFDCCDCNLFPRRNYGMAKRKISRTNLEK